MNNQKTTRTITIFGLGRMGMQIARRLKKRGFEVRAWNRSPDPVAVAKKADVKASNDFYEVIGWSSKEKQRIFWVMLPQGIMDDFLFGPEHIAPHLRKGDIVIDGGNSYFKDSIRRGERMAKMGVHYFDCGTSGGVWGEKNGFALMVGGPKAKWPMIEPFVRALSAGENYGYFGASGAGHFVKMVHNGIEYGMMEAIGEGYGVLKASPFKLDLGKVTKVYQQGTVIRSWLIDLCKNIFDNEDIEGTSGKIDATGEGEWTINTAHEYGVDVRVIEDSLQVRRESVDAMNQNKYSNKIVALMRKQFGGHAIHSGTDKTPRGQTISKTKHK